MAGTIGLAFGLLLALGLATGLVIQYPVQGWLGLIGLGLVPSAAGYALFYAGLRNTLKAFALGASMALAFAIVFAAGRSTPTIVAFGEPGDMVLLGAIALEGLNMRVDLPRRALVPAGPVPVAAA